ncbi:CGNR zinc finger domain-containing protein [Spirillospora sp. NPDC047279]|uniref:CGNR zinc finger domain-containing protein n=1 Tax=Spirillospora sp. NPDC047279 TaxID=3155478 RepID=UPI0033D7ED70
MGFTFTSGDLALDFAGTVQHRRSDRRDLLTTPADLAAWTVEAGLLTTPPGAAPPSTAVTGLREADLDAAIRLREAVYRLAAARTGAGTGTGEADDRDLVNQHAAGAPVTVRLTPGGTVERTGDLAAALASLARAAVELLGGPAAADIKECGADPCTRLYLDSSRRRSRRWCDMRECGNRAKAAAFRARHAADRP